LERGKKKKLGSSWSTQLCTNSGSVLPSFAASVTLNEAEKGREENNRKEKPKKERKAKLSVIMRAVRSVEKNTIKVRI
jgi:hypothetical protein